ncbi:hypothetical protein RI129_002189 [Pyrocoelia pectoralis]|uniref:UBZ4-type domain-containing protein n=1 Tax=Pyrocoelia pectoralis TaxID=417401 RepID=A0AAN7ZKU3_9COLE
MYNTPSISEDDDEDSPSMNQVAECLREAGSYDGGLSNKEMLEIYRVVNQSKATAENEQRRTDTNSINDFIDEMRLHSDPVEKPESSDVDVIQMDVYTESDSPETLLTMSRDHTDKDKNTDSKKKLDNFDEIDVFNSVPTKHPPLPQISYKPKYNPPLYCSTNIIHLSLGEKTKLIAKYHKELIHIYDSFQRESSQYAPLDKPIQPCVKFDGSLLKANDKLSNYKFEDEIEDFVQDNNLNEIYITKTGRQTKRKLYAETGDPWKTKSSPTSSQGSPTGPQPKKTNISSLNNDQIIKRSRLFTSKAEKMFDKLKEKSEQEKKEEKENTKFLNSLTNTSDDDFIDDRDVADLVHSEEPFIRRHVTPPPARMKKAPKGRGRNGKSKENATRNAKKTQAKTNEPKQTNLLVEPSTNKGTCPICSFEFPQNMLETHADQCIDTYEQKSTSTVLFKDSNKMVCENCDEAFPYSMDYENHVRECLIKST